MPVLRTRQADADEARGGIAAARVRPHADQQPPPRAVASADVELDAGCVAAAAGAVERGCGGRLACVGDEALRFSPPIVQWAAIEGGCGLTRSEWENLPGKFG